MTLKLLFRYLICASITLLFSQCSADKLEVVENDCNGEVAYSNQIKPIVDIYCAYSGCHDGSSGVSGNYTSYDRMERSLTADLFEDRTIVVRDMPPNYAEGPKSMTREDLDMLICWIENDYKN